MTINISSVADCEESEVELDIKRLPPMNGKPRFEIKVHSILNYRSNFGYKLLCDYLTFSLGSACVAKCAYCYVESIVKKHPQVKRPDAHAETPGPQVRGRRDRPL